MIKDNGTVVPLYVDITSLFEKNRFLDMDDNGIILLRNLNYDILHQPAQTNNPVLLQENGNGLINVLFQWKLKRQMPSSIKDALEELFPGWSIDFRLTDDGRILMRVNDGDQLLNPPSIPDGFYKLLAILAAVELNPRFLLIDEIETSLHAKIIEYILDELQTCNSTVVITTHSPAVIDLVSLKDLVLVERFENETVCRRIKEPDKLNKALLNEGLTTSEKWLYGKI